MHAEAADAEFLAVLFELRDLLGRDRIQDGQRTVGGRDAVVGGGDGEIGAADFEAAFAQALEGLRRGDFVHQMQIDVDKAGRAGLFVDDVGVPDFLAESVLKLPDKLLLLFLPWWPACRRDAGPP